MEKEKKWIVYKHTSPSGKIYIGITSQTPSERWRKGEGYKYCPAFYKAIKKYGWDNIEHEIISEDLDEETAKQKEMELIACYHSNNKNYGYNLTPGGDIPPCISRFGADNPFFGKHHSEETKQKLREMALARNNPRKRAVYQFSLQGDFIQEFESTHDAGKSLNKGHSAIARACRKELNSAYGYTWCYKEDCKDFESFKQEIQKRFAISKTQIGQGNAKRVIAYDKNKELIGYFPSASEAGRQLGIHKDTVAYSCKHHSLVYKKYYFCYEED